MKKLVFSFVFLVSMHVNAWAGTDLTIDYIDVKNGGNVSVYFTNGSDLLNSAGCNGHPETVSWEGTDDSAQNYLSAILAAKMAGRPVEIIVDSVCLWGGSAGWPKLHTVRIK